MIVIAFAWTSFELFKRSERALDEVSARSEETAALAAQVPTLLRRLSFSLFLQAWKAGDTRHARLRAALITQGTKEKKATAFLLDAKPIEEKIVTFEKSLANDYSGFAGFIIGEHYLRDDDREKAVNAYKNSFIILDKLRKCNVPVDSWLNTHLRARLYQLKHSSSPAPTVAPVEAGGLDK